MGLLRPDDSQTAVAYERPRPIVTSSSSMEHIATFSEIPKMPGSAPFSADETKEPPPVGHGSSRLPGFELEKASRLESKLAEHTRRMTALRAVAAILYGCLCQRAVGVWKQMMLRHQPPLWATVAQSKPPRSPLHRDMSHAIEPHHRDMSHRDMSMYRAPPILEAVSAPLSGIAHSGHGLPHLELGAASPHAGRRRAGSGSSLGPIVLVNPASVGMSPQPFSRASRQAEGRDMWCRPFVPDPEDRFKVTAVLRNFGCCPLWCGRAPRPNE